MVSCGNDRKMAVWDIRMFRYVPLNFNSIFPQCMILTNYTER